MSSPETISVSVTEVRQLFNSIDPSPFRERDLDPGAESFIVEWARELPRDAALSLVVHARQSSGTPEESGNLAEAIHAFFATRAQTTRRRLRLLFGVGRISLMIGLAVLIALASIAQAIDSTAPVSGFVRVLRESLVIGGWVAMWRPLEIFLYDWWPIRGEIRLYERLAVMPVSLTVRAGA